MSAGALRWAFALPIRGAPKAVLLALADHADKEGLCWPSISRIATWAGVCDRSARMTLRTLEARGLIAADERESTTTLYRLIGMKGEECDAAPPERLTAPPAPHASHTGRDIGADDPPPVVSPRQEMPPLPAPHAAEPSLSVQSSKRKESIKPKPSDYPAAPAWVPQPSWDDYVESRRVNKCALTPAAMRLSFKRLMKWRQEGLNIENIINLSVERGYRGLFDTDERKRVGTLQLPLLQIAGGRSVALSRDEQLALDVAAELNREAAD